MRSRRTNDLERISKYKGAGPRLQSSHVMRVQSLFYENFHHHVVNVEVTLHPGLPGVQILGLPDAVVKDCVWRLRSAFLQSGYQWPTSSQIIVNLRPSEIRKRGAGLDLAIAAALLWETGQVPKSDWGVELPLLYGEIDLLGQVHTPPDLVHYSPTQACRLTGHLTRGLPFTCLSVTSLNNLAEPVEVPAASSLIEIRRPEFSNFSFSEKIARVIEIIAAGEHPTLFVGRSGSGKSTIVQTIHSLLEQPSPSAAQEFCRYHMHKPLNWRPLRNPHHTTTCLAMIGGGVSAAPGEMTRAHGGTLVMDEFLEFETNVQEALREPMERGVIELIRSTTARTLPARFLLLATSNLCKCGGYEPGNERKCDCGSTRRRHYVQKLSGPVLDRFAIVVSSSLFQGKKSTKLREMFSAVEKAITFRLERGQEFPNCYLSAQELKKQLDLSAKPFLLEEDWVSERRILHLLRVSRTLADIEGQTRIQLDHLEDARSLTMKGHGQLKRQNYEIPAMS